VVLNVLDDFRHLPADRRVHVLPISAELFEAHVRAAGKQDQLRDHLYLQGVVEKKAATVTQSAGRRQEESGVSGRVLSAVGGCDPSYRITVAVDQDHNEASRMVALVGFDPMSRLSLAATEADWLATKPLNMPSAKPIRP
jgi:hypothetical protein